MELNWFIPSDGDGTQLLHTSVSDKLKKSARGWRAPTPTYLAQVARAAEHAGFHACLLPVGIQCHDPWLLTATLANATKNLKFIVAFRPGLELPGYIAYKAETLQRLTGGRLLLNAVTGSNAREQKALGDFLEHDQRYERTQEYLGILRGLWREKPLTFEGRYTQIEGGSLNQPLPPFPSLYFGGASPAAEQVAAQHCDVYLLWGETPEMVSERIARMSELAHAAGRRLRFGIRLHVIARRTEKEAWQEAQRLLDGLSPEAITAAQSVLQKTESTGQKRMLALHQGRIPRDARELEVRPNLWSGIGLVRSGAGTALVGSYQQVTARIQEYAELGLDSFIFSAYPNLEEAYRFGEQITPRLRFVSQERNSS